MKLTIAATLREMLPGMVEALTPRAISPFSSSPQTPTHRTPRPSNVTSDGDTDGAGDPASEDFVSQLAILEAKRLLMAIMEETTVGSIFPAVGFVFVLGLYLSCHRKFADVQPCWSCCES